MVRTARQSGERGSAEAEKAGHVPFAARVESDPAKFVAQCVPAVSPMSVVTPVLGVLRTASTGATSPLLRWA